MKVEGEHIFKGTQKQVWDLFRDTDVMAAALPGTEKMEAVGENIYEALMNVRVGPVAGQRLDRQRHRPAGPRRSG